MSVGKRSRKFVRKDVLDFVLLVVYLGVCSLSIIAVILGTCSAERATSETSFTQQNRHPIA